MKPAIAVIGSIVIDFPMLLPRPAILGETLKVQSPGPNLGGKAVNQGLQALLCGSVPALVGKIGQDVFGQWAQDELSRMHFGDQSVLISSAPTSWAVPIIEPDGQYILHVAGANAEISEDDVEASHTWWAQTRFLLVQGEIPSPASLKAAALMHAQGGIVICDPAPVDGMSPELLNAADILTPNTQELAMLSETTHATLQQQTDRIWSAYPHLTTLIVTLGAEGVWVQQRHQAGKHIAPPSVTAADPTAAGDAFNGALAAELSRGADLLHACEMGCCAGAVAATTVGAAKSLAPQKVLEELWNQTYAHLHF